MKKSKKISYLQGGTNKYITEIWIVNNLHYKFTHYQISSFTEKSLMF